MTVPDPTVRPTQFEVCCLPEDDDEAYAFTLTVEWRGPGDLWAVCRMRQCLGADGNWDREPSPSNREDDWKATHRFRLDEAIRLAKDAARQVVVNGWTVEAALARKER